MTLLDSKLQTDYSQGATTYTASGAERVLVINAETYNIGGGGTNTSRANTTISGTEISNEINLSSATGTNRDAQIRATLADLASADTVQCSNRPKTGYAGQIHILFSADEIQSVTNVAYQTYTDANNNHQYQYTAASNATLLCVCWNENNYNQQTSASITHSGSYTTIYENTWSSSPNSLCIGMYDVSAGDVITMAGSASSTAYGTQLYAVYEVTKGGGATRKYLLESGGTYYTVSGGIPTSVGSTLNAQLFSTYGLDDIPSWSDYSSLSNPSVLCWDAEEIVDMVATTTGLPSPQAIISEGISLIVQGTDGIDHIDVTDSGSPEYAFSIDGGTTWKIWSGSAWVTSAGTDMSGAAVEALTDTEWASLTSGASAIKIRFTLDAAADGVATVEVFYKQL